MGYFTGHDADFALVRESNGTGSGPHLEAVHSALTENARLAFRASPRANGGGEALPAWRIAAHEWARPFVRRLWEAQRMGPVLEIFALEGDER